MHFDIPTEKNFISKYIKPTIITLSKNDLKRTLKSSKKKRGHDAWECSLKLVLLFI